MTTLIDGVFHKGDRVEYKPTHESLHFLKPGASGIIVEVYPEGSTIRSNDRYPVAVAWPSLRESMPAGEGPQIMEGLDAYNLHEGDVIPMLANELKVTGNVYTEGY